MKIKSLITIALLLFGVGHAFSLDTGYYLVKSYNDVVYKKQTTPIALYVNLKATKRIGKHLKIAVFANRMIDYLPSYKSNGLTVRRASDPYFGMELNFDL